MAICPLKLAHSEHSLLPSRATTVSITEAGSRFASRAASSAIRWYPSIFSSPSLSRQEWARSSPVRNHEQVSRTGRRHEKQRPLPCFMVCGCNRVIVFRIQIERHVLGVDPRQDHHGELQPFDSVHRSQSNPGSLSLLVEQRARNSLTVTDFGGVAVFAGFHKAPRFRCRSRNPLWPSKLSAPIFRQPTSVQQSLLPFPRP